MLFIKYVSDKYGDYDGFEPVEEIASPKNDYNLNLPRYIDSTEPEDLQDIDGHLRGGIPERDLDDHVGAAARKDPRPEAGHDAGTPHRPDALDSFARAATPEVMP